MGSSLTTIMEQGNSNFNKHGIIPFKGDDFSDWAFRVKMLLEEQSLWTVVSTQANAAARLVAGWATNDIKARRIIVDCVDNKCLEYVKDRETSYDMWVALKSVYDASSYTKRVIAFKKLIRQKYVLTDDLQTFFRIFDVIAREYKSAGGTLADTELIVIMLSCLPDEFSGVVSAISTLQESQFTIDKVRGYLLEEECRIKDRKSLTVDVKDEVPVAFYSDTHVRCYNCNEIGHKSDKCPKPSKKQKNDEKTKFTKKKKWNKKGKFSKPGGNGHVLMIKNDVNRNRVRESRVIRFICDSACSNHLINDCSILRDVKSIEPLTMNLAKAGESLRVTHVGSLQLTSFVNGRESEQLTISDVHYSANITENLLSLGVLDEKGVSFKISNGIMTAIHNGTTLFVARKIGRLYYVEFELQSPCVNVVRGSKANSELWHRRLAHTSIQTICKMVENDVVKGISKDLTTEIDFCDCCAKSKMTRDAFKGKRPVTKRPLERIHSDVCGPFFPSHDGYRYYVTFIDDYTHMTNTYLLKYKSEVFDKFQQFVEQVEAHFNGKISRLRCDNGGEYTSKAFKSFCESKGIVIEYTVPYNPQMNGVAERLNRTICEKMRALLAESGLSNDFWGEAVLTSTYITNRTSTVSLHGKTPYELWFGYKPDLSSLRVFGCKAFAHVPHEKRLGKLSMPGKEYIFVGYSFNGYRLYDLERKMIVQARSVSFNEDAFNPSTTVGPSPNLDDIVENVSQSLPRPTVAIPLTPLSLPVAPNSPSTPKRSNRDSNEINSPSTPPTIVRKTPSSVIQSTPMSTIHESSDEFSTPLSATPVSIPIESRPRRNRVKPFWQRSGDFVMMTNYAFFAGNQPNEIPLTYNDVEENEEKAEWHIAIGEEINSLLKNRTWDVVDDPGNVKLVDSRWIFKKKINGNSYIFKARLVAKGYMQQEGVNYVETYAPVARLQTVRILLSVGNKFDLEIHHMDVKTAFLNGDLEEDVYMKPPQGVEVPKGKVLKLRKSLYGLKQSPRCWNLKFHGVMTKLGFHRSDAEPCLYIKSSNQSISIIVLYVDDMLFLSNDPNEMIFIKKMMSNEFELKDLGDVSNFMGLEVNRDRNKNILTISQSKYANEILSRFDMADCKPRSIPIETNLDFDVNDESVTNHPYRELLGSLMYLMLGSRPDLSYSINKMSRFQEKPTETHWTYLKGILRYIRGTNDYELVYDGKSDVSLDVFADSDWANDRIDRKSTTGYMVRVFENIVVWSSKKQSIVTLSSTEAEYVSACTAVQESVWIEKLLLDLDIEIKYPIKLFEDNFGCIQISKNPETKRTKHIDVKYHFLRNLVWNGRYVLKQVPSNLQIADVFTKALPRVQFERLLILLKLKRGEVLKDKH